jgi:hypothetical protein
VPDLSQQSYDWFSNERRQQSRYSIARSEDLVVTTFYVSLFPWFVCFALDVRGLERSAGSVLGVLAPSDFVLIFALELKELGFPALN